jgi:hypothetical protein
MEEDVVDHDQVGLDIAKYRFDGVCDANVLGGLPWGNDGWDERDDFEATKEAGPMGDCCLITSFFCL